MVLQFLHVRIGGQQLIFHERRSGNFLAQVLVQHDFHKYSSMTLRGVSAAAFSGNSRIMRLYTRPLPILSQRTVPIVEGEKTNE